MQLYLIDLYISLYRCSIDQHPYARYPGANLAQEITVYSHNAYLYTRLSRRFARAVAYRVRAGIITRVCEHPCQPMLHPGPRVPHTCIIMESSHDFDKATIVGQMLPITDTPTAFCHPTSVIRPPVQSRLSRKVHHIDIRTRFSLNKQTNIPTLLTIATYS